MATEQKPTKPVGGLPEPKFYLKGLPFLHGSDERKQLLEAAMDFQFEPDDILVAGVPRSGTTFRRQLIWLVAHDANIEEAKSIPLRLRMPNIDRAYTEDGDLPATEQIKQIKSKPRIIFTHLPYSFLEENAEKAGIKVICLLRNPKDIVVSSFHAIKFFLPQFGKEFAEPTFQQAVMYMSSNKCDRGNMIDAVKSYWIHREDPRFLFVFFEDTKRDYIGTIRKVATFLDKKLTAEQETDIVDFIDFDTFQKHQNKESSQLEKRDTTEKGSFVRKGEIGDWKNYFTVAQNEFFDRVLAKKLAGLDIPYQYE